MTRTIGAPARYSRAQQRRSGAHAAGWLLVQLLTGLVAVLYTLVVITRLGTAHQVPAWAAVAAVIFSALCVQAARRRAAASRTAARQSHGSDAEAQVLAALQRAGVSLVINGAELHAGGDADHVVAHRRSPGRGVLAVVETKAGGGNVRLQGRTILSGKSARPIPKDPVGQVRRQAAALARLTGREVSPIVCLPGMVNGPLNVDGVLICGARHLGELFSRSLPEISLDDRDVDALERSVRPKE